MFVEAKHGVRSDKVIHALDLPTVPPSGLPLMPVELNCFDYSKSGGESYPLPSPLNVNESDS